MPTVQDLIERSLRTLGAIATGETPSDDELADGLVSLNDLLESWTTERRTIYCVKTISKELDANTACLTIGPGGVWDVRRPDFIERAMFKLDGFVSAESDTFRAQLELHNHAQWSAIMTRSDTSAVSRVLYCDYAFPLANLCLWPIPLSCPTIELQVWNELAAVAALDDDVELPPAYSRALRYNLAVELAPEYGISVSKEISALAIGSRTDIMTINASHRGLNPPDYQTLSRPNDPAAQPAGGAAGGAVPADTGEGGGAA